MFFCLLSFLSFATASVIVEELVLYIPHTSSRYYTIEIDMYMGPFELNTTFSYLMLDKHNEKRALHGTKKLRWSTETFEYAANYSQYYNCSGILEHSYGKYGENLAYGYPPEGAIDAWYDEGKTYVYGTEDVYNHFTAMVWNNVDSVGCAYKRCPNDVLYIICSYDPPGNVIGYSSENVLPLKVIT
ncbi:Cysteine-rich secretory family protein [Candida parapsilosis]|uniref:SCP domain-containing protein n=2 Tax=Candida parapsilosis TaxID=5480 RepID=G8BDR9_CANPC|nr:uncharacterized protein CPAR2_210600 [Candida parapsilosis]KAF6054435.1 Cysteine-rich secretory family protein [Candida parapsilosis]KAF6056541.1 Cysteine-rich secretory family protein [Candida parapsilosis]KAF6059476.1 Cysteine-rich secretory family protein [Candida parapsilosis]KAF6068229.1 Cysteine-rich secretory family protein [Candida parapsilosis]CCE43416.1 hypothetical protein CPAR2_210600 [Candida parapsilosis]